MNDSGLFQEIDDELQRKKMEAFMRTYGRWILGIALMLVLGTAAGTGYRAYKERKEQNATSALIQTATDYSLDADQKITALQNIAAEAPKAGTSYLASLNAAVEAIKAGKPAQAVAIYDAMATNTAIEPFFRQMADLLSVQTQLGAGEPEKLLARLQPLMDDKGAWRFSAMEYAGHLSLKMGKKDEALNYFKKIYESQGVPGGLATRAKDMADWITQTK